jgi:PAS domain-containing protein
MNTFRRYVDGGITLKERINESELIMLERIIDGYIALDNDFRFTFLNKEAERLFMKPKEELINSSLWALHPDVTKSNLYIEFNRCLKKNNLLDSSIMGL